VLRDSAAAVLPPSTSACRSGRWRPSALVGGREAVLVLMATIVISDSAQYYSGRRFGRRPLAPSISPKKTREGAVGGLCSARRAMFAGGTRWLFPAAGPPCCWPCSARCVVALGIVGDLFESMLKRSAGVKDSSPPHPRPWRRARPHRQLAVCRAGVLRLRPLPAHHETRRDSRLHRLDRPERADGRRDARRSAARRRAGRRRQRGAFAEQVAVPTRHDRDGHAPALAGARDSPRGHARHARRAGAEGLVAVATIPMPTSCSVASSGTAALEAVLAAIEAGKTIALANKEVLVMAGARS
jgi:hypothetical protein